MVIVSCCSCPKLVACQPKSPAGANEFLSMSAVARLMLYVRQSLMHKYVTSCFYVSLHVDS